MLGKNTRQRESPKLHHLVIASSVGGVCAGLITVPFDVVKVRLQANLLKLYSPSLLYCTKYLHRLCMCADVCSFHNPKPRQDVFRGTYTMFKQILKEAGPRGFWKGLTPTLFQIIPQVTVYYTLYMKFKFALGFLGSELSHFYIPAVAGVGSRAIACFMIAPMELVRTNLQSHHKMDFVEVYRYARHSVRANGLFSLWRGYSTILIRDIPFTAFYWSAFEALNYRTRCILKPNRGSAGDLGITLFASALCGTIAAALTTPSDVLKTNVEISIQKAGQRSKSLFQAFRDINRQFGLRGFFEGVIPRCAKIGPACAIMLTSYEVVYLVMNTNDV